MKDRDRALARLIRLVGGLNPKAGVIGEGMVRELRALADVVKESK